MNADTYKNNQHFFIHATRFSPRIQELSKPDIIHLWDSKELFLIYLLLFILRLCRPPPTPPAIIILISLCFPGLIASRTQLIFCRRKSKFVKKKSAAGDKERRREGGGTTTKTKPTIFQVQFTNTDKNSSIKTNNMSPLCHTNSV